MADSKQYFEDVADQWDTIRTGFFSEKVREIAYETSRINSGDTAVDIGAGTGFLSEGLLAKGAQVIAVDQSEAMLDTMRNKFKDTGEIEYRQAQADTHLPIADNAVRYAFSNMYLHHVESPPDAIKEMVRVVEPGGMVVLTDLDEHEHTFLRDEQNDRWMGFDRSDIDRWFKDAGLRDVTIDCVGEDCCGTSCDGSESASISIFVASGRK